MADAQELIERVKTGSKHFVPPVDVREEEKKCICCKEKKEAGITMVAKEVGKANKTERICNVCIKKVFGYVLAAMRKYEGEKGDKK